ncbi:MAG: V-type ATP synthase subunit E [Planctomycetota bacterium]
MSETEKPDALADEILADARRQAERKLKRARRRAKSLVRSANKRAAAAKEKAAEQAQQRAEHEAERVLADIPHEEQLRRLRAKAAVIGQLFDDVVEEVRSSDDRPALFARLAADAIGRMQGDAFVVDVPREDAPALGDEFGGRVADEVARSSGRTVSARLEPTDRGGGGVIVRSADGRQVVDNSLATRVERMRPRLRDRIAGLIFGDDAE